MARWLMAVVVIAASSWSAPAWAWEKGGREALKDQYRPSNILFSTSGTGQWAASAVQVGAPQAAGAIQPVPQQRQQADQANRASTNLALPAPEAQRSSGAAGYAIYQTEYQAAIEEEIAFVETHVKLEVLRKGSVTRIPLVNSSVGLKEVSLNKRPSMVNREGQSYVLLVDKPGKYDLTVKFFVKVSREREHGPGTFSFSAIPSPISLLDVQIEEPDMDLFVEPSIKIERETVAEKTVVTVVLPYTEWIKVHWTKAAQKVEIPTVKMEPKLYADTTTLVSIGEGVAQLSSTIRYSILQSEVSRFELLFPEDVALLDVQGRDLRDWKALPKDGHQLLDVFLNRGVKGPYDLKLTYERTIGEGSAMAQLPEMLVLGVEREKGLVGIQARTNVEIAFHRLANATEIDVKELPPELWNQAAYPVLLAYKYLKHPVEAEISVTKHEEVSVLVAAIDAANYVTLLTREGKMLTGATFQMRNNVKQFMRLELPKGATFLSCFVSGNPVKPAQDQDGRILVPLEKSETVGETVKQFPVEVMYLMQERPLEIGGKLRMHLPKLDIPTTQLYWSLYLPEDFNYWGFRGDVKLARQESPLGFLFPTVLRARSAVQVGTQSLASFSNVQQMEEQTYDAMKRAYTKGALPIRITIPTAGSVLRFSKLLVTDESPWLGSWYVRNVTEAQEVVSWILFVLTLIGGALLGRSMIHKAPPLSLAHKGLAALALIGLPLGLWFAHAGTGAVVLALFIVGCYLLSLRWRKEKPAP